MSVPPINPTDLARSMGDPAAIGKHPMHRPMVHLNADNDDAPLFERHQLIAMAACLVIGGLFAAGVHFLPVVAGWVVGL